MEKSLAVKYRPTSWDDVSGQDAVKVVLKQQYPQRKRLWLLHKVRSLRAQAWIALHHDIYPHLW